MKKIQTRIKVPGKQDSMDPGSESRVKQISEVVERRATRQQVSMDTHYEKFIFYKQSNSEAFQELCPCWRDSDPAAACSLCHGFGYLPPYVPLGHTRQILLHADSIVSALNMYVNYNSEEDPPRWTLEETALNGRLESDWVAIMPSDGESFSIWTDTSKEEDQAMQLTIEYTINGTDWKPVIDFPTEIKNISKMKIRITVSRDDLDQEAPTFSGLHIKYRNRGFVDIQGTQPQWARSTERVTAGRIDLIDNGIFIATGNISEMHVGDFFEHIETETRFRVQSIENNQWNGTIMEWALQVRKIQETEILFNVK